MFGLVLPGGWQEHRKSGHQVAVQNIGIKYIFSSSSCYVVARWLRNASSLPPKTPDILPFTAYLLLIYMIDSKYVIFNNFQFKICNNLQISFSSGKRRKIHLNMGYHLLQHQT
jgi:hypothetical protein